MAGKITIVTSSWRTRSPDTHARISISRSAPRGESGFRVYRPLHPGSWFRSLPTDAFVERYQKEILDPLDAQSVVEELLALSGDRIPTLTCWEPADPDSAWCHRSLVSRWLHETLGLEVFELGFEECGCGPKHPKLPGG